MSLGRSGEHRRDSVSLLDRPLMWGEHCCADRATVAEVAAGIVGRDDELARGERFLHAVESGRAALVIDGEPGAGKTTLWRELIDRAALRGARVLEARPAEPESQLSYAALSDLLARDFDATTDLPPPQRHALAAALLRADTPEPVDVRAVGTGVVAMLESMAAAAPLVVAVDDMQWLDTASARALTFAARRLPNRVGLLVTRRTESDPALPLGLDQPLTSGHVDRIVAGPLSVAVLHHIISNRLGRELPRPMLVRVAEVSGGNPFFALEIARTVGADPPERLLGALPLPASLSELVTDRLRQLSAEMRDVLLVVAAMSRPTVAAAERASEGSANVRGALAEAERAGVVVSDGVRLRFAHPLLLSAIYGGAPSVQRVGLHRRLAAVSDDPEERATHVALSTPEPEDGAAAEVDKGAAHASARGAPDRAAELFEASLRLTPLDRLDGRARRLLGRASALNIVGAFGEARSCAEEALALAVAPSLRVSALSMLASLAWFSGGAAVACGLLEEAIRAAGDDQELRGPLYAKLVRFSLVLDVPSAVTNGDLAAPLLDEEREPFLLAHVQLDRFFAAAHLGTGADPRLLDRGLALEASALQRSVEPPHPYPLIWFHCTDAHERARDRHAFEDEWYRQRGEEVWRADRKSHLAITELHAGRWDRADELAAQGSAALEHVEVRGPFAMVFEKRALVDAHLGRVDAARAALTPLIDRFEAAGQDWWAALVLSTCAFAEYVAGDYAAVDEYLARMRRHTDAVGAREVPTDRSDAFHVEALLALGAFDRAHEALDRFEARASRLRRPWTDVVLPRARALVRAHDGDLAGALDELERVDATVGKCVPFEYGWTLLVKGGLLRRGRQKRAAAIALSEALELFDGLGAPTPWRQSAADELDRVGLRPAAPLELTESERRVAELAATGLTNREVAAQLFMSPKTVEATLGRAYRKLGIRSRAQLGAHFGG